MRSAELCSVLLDPLALLSHAAMWPPLVAASAGKGFAGYAAVSVPSLLFLLYLPAVLFLLRQPNAEVEDHTDGKAVVYETDN